MIGRRALIVAALLAGAASIGLVVLGWWAQDWQYISDWNDPQRLSGELLRGVGLLILGKTGFKVALAVVVAVIGLAGWARARAARSAAQAGTPPLPDDPAGTPPVAGHPVREPAAD